MDIATAVLMADYNRWMNQRLYDAAAHLSEDDLMRDRGAFFGSLFGTLNHIAVGDTIWLRRFAQPEQAAATRRALYEFPSPTSLREPLAGSLADLRRYRAALDACIVDWAGTLTVDLLASTLSYRNTSGQARVKPFGLLVQHYFNHQTHHRGQATTLLFQAGVDVGDTDLLARIPDA